MVIRLLFLFIVSFVTQCFADGYIKCVEEGFTVHPAHGTIVDIKCDIAALAVNSRLNVTKDDVWIAGCAIVGDRGIMIFYTTGCMSFIPFPVKVLGGEKVAIGQVRGTSCLWEFKRDLELQDELPMIECSIDGYRATDALPYFDPYDENNDSKKTEIEVKKDGKNHIKCNKRLNPRHIVRCDVYFLNSTAGDDKAFLLTMNNGKKFLHYSFNPHAYWTSTYGEKPDVYWVTLNEGAFVLTDKKIVSTYYHKEYYFQEIRSNFLGSYQLAL